MSIPCEVMREAFRFAYMGDDGGGADESCSEIEAIARGEMLHVECFRHTEDYFWGYLALPNKHARATAAGKDRARVARRAASRVFITEAQMNARRDLLAMIVKRDELGIGAAMDRVSAADRSARTGVAA
jgi:hypothetical protein